uniref:Uncharacterized protein n=1 Tax=Setaria italica TaxID=4555 RepID=K3ZGU2_SETIT
MKLLCGFLSIDTAGLNSYVYPGSQDDLIA